jgi:chorismate dehydratase
MSLVRLGAVGYLNARPLVFGLEDSPLFEVRFDVPSKCADLLHGGAIDVGMIPSIEYLRLPAGAMAGDEYRIVPDLAIASRGPVASVALYTTKPMADVRSIAMDVSSRTSVALVRVLCSRHFNIGPRLASHGPDLASMLAVCDAALLIGDNALFQASVVSAPAPQPDAVSAGAALPAMEKIDLGEVWTSMTGLPFVWAFWAGRRGVLSAAHVRALREARDAGVSHTDAIAREYFRSAPDRQSVGMKYLRDNIKYGLGPDERAALELFYRYSMEAGVIGTPAPLRFFDQ